MQSRFKIALSSTLSPEEREQNVRTLIDPRDVGRIPKGFRLKAQGCEPRATLGNQSGNGFNPNGVATAVVTLVPQPRWGWRALARRSQGSSLLATLGWRTQSLWDWLKSAPKSWVTRCLVLLLLCSFVRAAVVTETTTEFLSSGDFNGDGRLDAIVLDKATGNARVGYQNASGALTWAAPVPSGVARAGSLAVGRFISLNRDAIAVTSFEFNRIHILDLSVPGLATPPRIVNPPHDGISSLIQVTQLQGANANDSAVLDWLTTATHDPGLTLLDLLAFGIADGLSSFQDQIAAEGTLVSLGAFERNLRDDTLLAAIKRGSNDTFAAYTYTNSSGPILIRSNLPSGSEYAFGRFHSETYARLLFYVPGQSNLTVQRLVNTAGVIGFGTATVTTFTSAVHQVYFLDEGTNGVALVRFGNGVSGLRPPAGNDGPLRVTYGFGLGTSGNVVSLGSGKFASLTGNSNSLLSATANVFTKNSTGYVQTSSSALSATTTSGTRANVWLFNTEPFVNAQPGFIASLNGGGWTTTLSGLPGTVRVRVESDQGATSGLGNANTNTLGAPPSGSVFGLANQYHPAISLFSYSAPRAADPSRITISPAPGAYSAAIQVSLTKANPADSAYFRFNGAGAWTEYFTPFTVSNDVTVAYYGQTLGGARGTLQQAAYTIAGSTLPPLLNTNGVSGGTNTPPTNTNANPFQLATVGTLFYGRQSGSTGSVWAINLDGTSDQFVTTGTRPRVSPDGRWLAFAREGSPFLSLGNLWLRDLLTGEERRLFTNPNFVVLYDWLNDSSGLVFDYECGIYTIDLAGVIVDLPMQNDCYDDAPVVNPFDGRISFHNLNIAPLRGLYQSDPAGSTRQRYNISVAGPAWPAWSPNGTMLSFANVRPATGTGQNLYTMPSDGSEFHQLTGFIDPTNGFPFGALWSPEGDALVGAGSIRGVNGLWVLPLNETASACVGNPYRLPTTPGDLIDIAGSIRVGIAPPKLFIRREPGVAIVFWDARARNFLLEASAVLGPNAVWMPVNGPYPVNAGFHEVVVPNPDQLNDAFFRLRHP